MELNGMEWNGMEWNGMEWNGTRTTYMLSGAAAAASPAVAGSNKDRLDGGGESSFKEVNFSYMYMFSSM